MYKKLRRRWADLALLNLQERLAAESSTDALALEDWLSTIVSKQPALIRAACGRADVIRSLCLSQSASVGEVIPMLFGGLSHLDRPKGLDGYSFGGLQKWVEPHRKFSVFFEGEGSARIGADHIDLFDSAWSVDEPLLRLFSKALHPEYLAPEEEVARRLSYHRHWRFGLPGEGVVNVRRWVEPGRSVDRLEQLAQPELVALTVASRMLGQHVFQWAERFAENVQGVEYGVFGEEKSETPLLVSLSANSNPIRVAEALLAAEMRANACSYWLLAGNTQSGRGRSQGAMDQAERAAILELAEAARSVALHACLMAYGHQAADSDWFRARRASHQDALANALRRVEGMRGTNLGRFEATVVDGARTFLRWSKTIANASKTSLHHSKPKKILVVNLDLQDTTYSWMLQQCVSVRATQRGHLVDTIGPSLTKAGTDIPCEMGLESGLIAPNVRREYVVVSKDLDEARGVLREALSTESYDAVIGNLWAPHLYILLEESGQDLTSIPIVLYDRHMHHDLLEMGTEGDRVSRLKAHRFFLNCMIEPEYNNKLPQIRLKVGFDKKKTFSWPWSVADGFFLKEPPKVPSRLPKARGSNSTFRLFSGGDSKRDYGTLFQAVDGLDVDLRIASGRSFEKTPDNTTPLGRIFLHEFRDEVRNCDAVVVPLGVGGGRDPGAAGITVFALAFAMGKPVICTDFNFTRRYIEHGKTGLLVEPENADAMRNAILRLKGAPEECAEIAMNASAEDFYHSDLADVFLEQIDGENTGAVQMPRPWRPRFDDPPSVAIIYDEGESAEGLRHVQSVCEAFVRTGCPCKMVPATTAKARGRFSRGSSMVEQLREAKANVVILWNSSVAVCYYDEMQRSGDSLASTLILLDHDKLVAVEKFKAAFQSSSADEELGRWWGSRNLQVVAASTEETKRYLKLGIPSSSLFWIAQSLDDPDDRKGDLAIEGFVTFVLRQAQCWQDAGPAPSGE